MIKILFVDDDQDVLDGFKRVLFKMRKEWDMEFVTSGEEALEMLEKEPFNAVVTDVGMSGISGMELFRIVKESHPEVARVIVSGSADLNHLIKAMGTAHQFLLKPVNPTTLKDTLSRVIALRNYLADINLQKVVHRIDSLPTQPQRHLELVQAISSASIKEIADIIKQDLAMTVKVLQLVNSPFWGIKIHIQDISQAVTLIGVDILQALVLTLEIFSKFQVPGPLSEELGGIFNHSRDVADYARVIAAEITHDKIMAYDSYMSGMLHDIGKLIILSYFTESFFKIKERLTRSKKMTDQVEKEILTVSHSQLGAYLLGLWGLPEFLAETAAYHHSPGEYLGNEFSPLTAVHIADAIKHSEADAPTAGTGLPIGLDLKYLDRLNLNLVDRIPYLIARINEINETPLPSA